MSSFRPRIPAQFTAAPGSSRICVGVSDEARSRSAADTQPPRKKGAHLPSLCLRSRSSFHDSSGPRLEAGNSGPQLRCWDEITSSAPRCPVDQTDPDTTEASAIMSSAWQPKGEDGGGLRPARLGGGGNRGIGLKEDTHGKCRRRDTAARSS